MEPVLVFNLLQSLSIMNHVFKVFNKYCIEGIKANAVQCKVYVGKSVGIITALNPHLGYETSANIAHEAMKSKVSIRDLCISRKLLSEKELDEILDPYEMTHPGISGSKLLVKRFSK